MTLNDLLKKIPENKRDKVIIFTDGNGWTNVEYVKPSENDSSTILLKESSNSPFKDEN